MTGLELIGSERVRQVIKEGWTLDHDDRHDDDEMAMAAMSYACPSDFEGRSLRNNWRDGDHLPPEYWPWDNRWWKPTPDDRIRELVKAGALIAAEIDRLLRLEGR